MPRPRPQSRFNEASQTWVSTFESTFLQDRPSRLDIQVLRGFAVALVVLYHVDLVPLAGGYLGVDIFFVVSGFLITGLVRRDMEAGRFNFRDFYFRRAKRLLPAAYTTFFVTALLGLFILNRLELADLAWQVVGGVTYTANFVLWQQADYFGGESELKPLLHIWSLAVEEQYYLLLPLSLLLAGRRRWMALAVGVTLASGLLCAAGVVYKPVATFYLLPTRAWELGVGSIGALLVAGAGAPVWRRAAQRLFLPAVGALLLIPVFPIGIAHPGVDALVVCVATLVVILRAHPMPRPALPARVMGRLGDISYSMYLVHWPLIALINNAWVGPADEALPLWLRAALLLAALVLAALQYRFVEQPFRSARIGLSRPLLARTAVASLALMLMVPGGSRALIDAVDYKHVRRINYGLSKACESETSFVDSAECRTSDAPRILVWGDSFAMHLVPGLADTLPLVQATKSACGPLLGLAPWRPLYGGRGIDMSRAWAKGCLSFNDSVIEYLKRQPSIEFVVLSSPFNAYVAQGRYRHLSRHELRLDDNEADADRTVEAMQRTVKAVRELGKQVVVVAPPPSAHFNIGACLERMTSGRLLLGAPFGCEVDAKAYAAARTEVLRLLVRMTDEAGVEVVRFDDFLCDESRCRTSIEGTLLYRDGSHLSYDGSRLLARQMDLPARIRSATR